MTDQTDNHRITMRISDVRISDVTPDGFRDVVLVTSRGEVECRHYAGGSSAAVLWLGGAGGGWDTPARDLYPELARELARNGVSSLRIKFRFPGVLAESVLDAIAGLTYLADCGDDAMGIVGHSFGGAVAIQAAASVPMVRLVVGLASQAYGADPVATLGPRCAVLLAHGTDDAVVPADASRAIYELAVEPRQLELYTFADHMLDLPANEIRRQIRDGVDRYVAKAAVWPPHMALSSEEGAR